MHLNLSDNLITFFVKITCLYDTLYFRKFFLTLMNNFYVVFCKIVPVINLNKFF